MTQIVVNTFIYKAKEKDETDACRPTLGRVQQGKVGTISLGLLVMQSWFWQLAAPARSVYSNNTNYHDESDMLKCYVFSMPPQS